MNPEHILRSILDAAGPDPEVVGGLRLSPDGGARLAGQLTAGLGDRGLDHLCAVIGFLASREGTARLALEVAMLVKRSAPGVGTEERVKQTQGLLGTSSAANTAASWTEAPDDAVRLRSIAPLPRKFC
jgi:hypothetical protein